MGKDNESFLVKLGAGGESLDSSLLLSDILSEPETLIFEKVKDLLRQKDRSASWATIAYAISGYVTTQICCSRLMHPNELRGREDRIASEIAIAIFWKIDEKAGVKSSNSGTGSGGYQI